MDRGLAPAEHAQRAARYAVIFRTHFWDAFTARQMQRLRERVRNGDIYVVVDETSGPIAGIDHDRVMGVTEAQMSELGLPLRGANALEWYGPYSLMWFNGDYALYAFLSAHPDYDYYVQLEYDVVLHTDVDEIVARCEKEQADFVGLTRGEPVETWAWRHTCADAYGSSEIIYKLICFCIFSRQALRHLFERRLALATSLRPDQGWPFCEGFIATEVAIAGMHSPELTDFVDTSSYDTWPPVLEADLPSLAHAHVIHPVLDQPRYISSVLKWKVGLSGYLNPVSLLHRKLRRLPPRDYVQTLASSFAAKARRTLHQRGILRG